MGHSFPELGKQRLLSGITINDIATLILYVCFSVYLYLPSVGVNNAHVFCGFNAMAAAWGAYFLSRRWVNNWTPSLLTGAAYGFGPFALSFGVFHPLAGLSFAMVPWLLLPAVYWHKGKTPDLYRFSVRALLALLPFAGIILWFWLLAQPWAGPNFLMPKNMALTIKDFTTHRPADSHRRRVSAGFLGAGLSNQSDCLGSISDFVFVGSVRPRFSGVIVCGQSGYQMDRDLCRRRLCSGGFLRRYQYEYLCRKGF